MSESLEELAARMSPPTHIVFLQVMCDKYPEAIIAMKAEDVPENVNLESSPFPCPLRCGKEHSPVEISAEDYEILTAEDEDYEEVASAEVTKEDLTDRLTEILDN